MARNRVHDNFSAGIEVDTGRNRIIDNVVTGNVLGGDASDLIDINWPVECGSNIWLGNTYGQAAPACTTIGGHHVAAPAAPRSAPPASAAAHAQASAGPRYALHRGTSHQ